MRTLDTLSYGPEVAALGRTSGRVRAVLRNAVYLESLEGRIIGIVGSAAPDGPLTLRIADLPLLRQALGRRPDATFQATEQGVEIAAGVQIRWMGARAWLPPQPQPAGRRAARRQAAEALVAAIGAVELREGARPLAAWLPSLLRDGAEQLLPQPAEIADPVARRMATWIIAFDAALGAGDATGATQALTGLLGLGPGLTPSGDDVAMGLLAALVWQSGAAPSPLVTAVVAAIRAAAPQRSTRLSARLLWHAGAGVLYAPAMDLGAALLRGDAAAVPPAARPLFAIGGTSGVDLAVGLLAGVLISAPSVR